MKIKVFREEAIQRFTTDKKHIVISIQDPNYDFVKLPTQESRIGWIGVKCYDFDKKTGQEIFDNYLFTRSQAITILDLVDKWKDKIELICVNCVAGISRSAGTAAALAKILNNDEFYFFNNYCPNMLIYRTILGAYYK